MALFGGRSGIQTAVQTPDSNTYEIGGSRFGLYDGNLMNGAYGQGGTNTPGAFATPSIPPVYPNVTAAGQYGMTTPPGVMQPFNPKYSPLVLVVVLGIAAVAALHWLHWHDRSERRGEE